jgi:RNA polymerase sigma-70 factor (ECF subfamily)
MHEIGKQADQERIDYAALAEIELVQLAQQDDSAAFSDLVRRHYGACIRMAISIVRNRADAEDEVQNAFMKAFIHLPEFELRANFRTWLIRIVLNHCLMNVRRSNRIRLLSADTVTSSTSGEPGRAIIDELRAESKTPEEEYHSKESAMAVISNIHQLPSLFRQVLALQGINEMRVSNLAEQLGISQAAAKSRLNRARCELRSRLREQFSTRYSKSAINISRSVNL